ncbi:hypothetical protein IPJ72_06170 [Candidatus Peregrinibacteria bacterium]|nr:MAG: hypothetical protein IPJ72_06170 [Candidatus Peregrinibacteria bacterium]
MALADFTQEMRKEADELKQFLYQNFYQSPVVSSYNEKGKEVITVLFNAMRKNPDLLPEKIRQNPHNEKEIILIKDYIAGMTDQFALELYNKVR